MSRIQSKTAELRAYVDALILDLRSMAAVHPGRAVRVRLLTAYTSRIAELEAASILSAVQS